MKECAAFRLRQRLMVTLMLNNSDYWRGRYEAMEDKLNAIAEEKSADYIRHVKTAYARAQTDIERDIEAFYGRYAKNNKLTIQEARRQLTYPERKKLQMSLEDYISEGQKLGLNNQWKARLENAATAYEVSRLEAFNLGLRHNVEKLTGDVINAANGALGELYTESYLRNAYEYQRGATGFSIFASPDERLVKRTLARPWTKDGLDFSERVWGKYRPKLVYELETTFTSGIMRGKAPNKIVNDMWERLVDSRSSTERLVITESAAISSMAQEECFNSLGVEEFENICALDDLTCDNCGPRDGSHFPMGERQIGENAPPFHPYCRCITCPYYNDEFTKGATRAARDSQGYSTDVSKDMSFDEWKKKYVETVEDGSDLESPADENSV